MTLVAFMNSWLAITVIDVAVPGEQQPDLSRSFPQAVVMPAGVIIENHRMVQQVTVRFYSDIQAGAEAHYEALLSLAALMRLETDFLLVAVGESELEDGAFLVAEIVIEDNRG